MLDKSAFFKKYDIEKALTDSDLEWKTLQEIYDDYVEERPKIEQNGVELIEYIKENLTFHAHSIYGRTKDPDHLIEKIIRKRGIFRSHKYKGICKDNYKQIVRDLMGIRILTLAKEQWEAVHNGLVEIFPQKQHVNKPVMAEPPQAYTRYGDRDIFGEKIHKEHSNKGYRSQHYIVKFKQYYGEIQVRTLSEEVFGEFDHKVKYPYRESNKFLIRYTNMVSQFLDSVDEMISTCFQLEENGWNNCNQYYQDDVYIDWKEVTRKPETNKISEKSHKASLCDTETDMGPYAKRFLLRKDKSND